MANKVAFSALLYLLVLLSVAAAQQPGLDLQTIVSRMEQAHAENRAAIRAYTVTRKFALFSKDQVKPKSEVLADITFQPPETRTYQIKKSIGSGQGEKVVRKVLDRESEMAKDADAKELTRRNYDFQLLGERSLDGRRCYLLQLIPKREDKNLVAGHAWIDAGTYLVRRVQGRIAKNPSFWVKDVQLVLTYGAVEGMWLQVASDATADVRLFGKHRFIARDVGYRTTAVVAVNSPPRPLRSPKRPPRLSPAAALGGGVLR